MLNVFFPSLSGGKFDIRESFLQNLQADVAHSKILAGLDIFPYPDSDP